MSYDISCLEIFGIGRYLERKVLRKCIPVIPHVKAGKIYATARFLPIYIVFVMNLTFFLYLSNNRLTALPNSLGNLSNLVYLNATDNQLTALPETLGNLANLKELTATEVELIVMPLKLKGCDGSPVRCVAIEK